MRCESAREALSAQLDNEQYTIDEPMLRYHLSACVNCAEWIGKTTRLTSRISQIDHDPIYDLTPAILAELGGSTSRRFSTHTTTVIARRALLFCAIVLIAITTSSLIFNPLSDSIHTDHELLSWDIALAFGFIAAAFKPHLASGMLPIVSAVCVLLMTTSLIDIASNHTTALAESPHSVGVIGLTMLWVLTRNAKSQFSAAISSGI